MLSERLQILVSPEQRQRLEAEAAEQGKSVGGIIRDAIESRYGNVPYTQRVAALEAIEAMRAQLPDDPAAVDRLIDQSRLAETLGGVTAHPSG